MTLLSELRPPLIIALHGAVTNAASWLPIQRELGASIELVAPDLPGHGTKRREPFSLEAAVKQVEELVGSATSEGRTVLLVGDSLGSYVALLTAERQGEKISGVVAGSATFSMTGLSGGLARLTDIPVRAAQLLIGPQRSERLAGRILGRFTDASTAEAVVVRGIRIDSRSESLHALRNIDFKKVLQNVAGPVYFVNGAFDVPVRWYTKQFARRAREGYAVIIPGAAHGCMFTHPHACADVIRAALVRITMRQARSR